MIDEYVIQFEAKGEKHKVVIDLVCLRNALKPAPEPERTCWFCVKHTGMCPHCLCVGPKPSDRVEVKIKSIAECLGIGKEKQDDIANELRALVRLARG